jgi:polyhydroxybutyrate depolymerase
MKKNFLDNTVLSILGVTVAVVTVVLVLFMNNRNLIFSSQEELITQKRLPASNVSVAGNYHEVFSYRGMERQALVYVPSQYDPKKEEGYPLLIALHGYGGDAMSMAEITGFSAIADREKFIVVYPEGIEHSWNAYICCGKAQQNNIDDIGFMSHIIDNLSDRLSIDEKKVYLTGFSNGGMLAYYTAAQFPKKIVAIAPVAASIGGTRRPDTPLIQPSKFSSPISAVMIHAADDEYVPYEGGESPVENISFTSFEESLQYWKDQNNCDVEPIRSLSSNDKIEKNKYECINGSVISTYVVQEGGHQWFDEKQGFKELQNVNTLSELIWDFFKNQVNENGFVE